MTGFIPLIAFLLMLILIISKTFILKKNNIQIRSKSKKRKTLKFILYPVFLLLILYYMLEIFRHALQFSILILPSQVTNIMFGSKYLQIFGTCLMLFSLILLFFTLKHFNRSFRFGMNSENLGTLISNGVFSLSRNPFFLSLELYFWGVAVQIPSPFFIGFALLATVSIHFFILKEEKFMKENYGEEYKKYAYKVRRYF